MPRFYLPPALLTSVLAAVFLLFVYGRFIEPDRIQITHIKIEDTALKTALKGRKIVHISDLHFSDFTKKESSLLKTIEQINPDLVFLTGDYITWRGDIQPAMTFFSRIKARIGVYAVLGDYDYSDSRQSCLFCHEKGTGSPTKQHQVQMLQNSVHKILINGNTVSIAGIDYHTDDTSALEKKLGNSDADLLMVLSHDPFNFDSFEDTRKLFMFSGDTHGGQIRLPGILFRLFGYSKNVVYNYGMFKKGNKTLYVTSGTGTSHIRFRLFCPPEIAVFEF